MRRLQRALVELIESPGSNWYGPGEVKKQKVFQIVDLEFSYNHFGKHYTINYYGIAYRMPETLANRLCKWQTKQYSKTVLSYPNVEQWYDQLSQGEKKKIKRYDYNNQNWF